MASGDVVTQVGGAPGPSRFTPFEDNSFPAGTLMPVRGLPAIRVVVEPDIYFHGG